MNKILEQEASSLEVLFSDEEIKQAMWDCESSKAPGPNGYSFNFIKKCRHLIAADLLKYMQDFFKIDTFPRRANMTWVTFIPKVDDAKK